MQVSKKRRIQESAENDNAREQKTDNPREQKTDNPREQKTDNAREQKTDRPSEQKRRLQESAENDRVRHSESRGLTGMPKQVAQNGRKGPRTPDLFVPMRIYSRCTKKVGAPRAAVGVQCACYVDVTRWRECSAGSGVKVRDPQSSSAAEG
ncbi:hypothetical protein NDU88_010264 [Pleurodeles waltl]|uniref:Uncharacterized protein n=1 Tax=Pleurodeles waltl TaxID=8319 RepID=A0AAV7PXJ2_PLEWA|nr:hypothetical protein NDU88_010264 [Pleurodeles waltl]